MDDGRDDPLNLIVEIKGYKGEDAKEKNNAMEAYWLPGVNALSRYGRWAFVELTDVFDIESNLRQVIDSWRRTARGGEHAAHAVSLVSDGGGDSHTENIARRQSEEYADHLVEQHRRQGEGMMKFLEFQRGLPDHQRGLNQRERFLLFLERESHRSEEGRQNYLKFLEHERPYKDEYNLEIMDLSWPDADDSH